VFWVELEHLVVVIFVMALPALRAVLLASITLTSPSTSTSASLPLPLAIFLGTVGIGVPAGVAGWRAVVAHLVVRVVRIRVSSISSHSHSSRPLPPPPPRLPAPHHGGLVLTSRTRRSASAPTPVSPRALSHRLSGTRSPPTPLFRLVSLAIIPVRVRAAIPRQNNRPRLPRRGAHAHACLTPGPIREHPELSQTAISESARTCAIEEPDVSFTPRKAVMSASDMPCSTVMSVMGVP